MNDILTKKDKLSMPFAVKSDAKNTHKEVDTTARTVSFIGNTYYFVDSYGDVLLPGCCAKSIQDRGPQSKLPGKIKHFSNHNLQKGIGRFEKIEETKYENMDVLWAESWMSETDLGEETLIKYNEGIIDQHSIGFRYLQLDYIDEESDEWEDTLAKLINPEVAEARGSIWLVPEIKLYEISSLDGFGANQLTPFLGSKSENVNVKCNNMFEKLDKLREAFKKGGDKDHIEMQYAQIKQMIYELYNQEPSIKDTLKKPSEKGTFDAIQTINNFKF